jgi:hypothetical protein
LLGWGWFRNGLGIKWRRFEARGDLSAPDISSKNVGVFVPGEFDGLVEGLTEIGEDLIKAKPETWRISSPSRVRAG